MMNYTLSSSSPSVLFMLALTPNRVPIRDDYFIKWGQGIESSMFRFDLTRNFPLSQEFLMSLFAGMQVVDVQDFTASESSYAKNQEIDHRHPLVAIFKKGDPHRGMVSSFGIYPSPQRSYREMVNDLLRQKMPKIDILIGEYAPWCFPTLRLDNSPWDHPNIIVTESLSEAYKKGKIWCIVSEVDSQNVTMVPRKRIELDYETVLDLLWDLPASDNPVVQLDKIIQYKLPGAAMAIRFTDRDNHGRKFVGIEYINTYRNLDFTLRRTNYLFADSLVMLAGLLGFFRMPMNEILYLMLTWWNLAVSNVAYHISSSSAKRSSVLLLSDMFRRMGPTELDYVESMIDRLKGNKYADSVFSTRYERITVSSLNGVVMHIPVCLVEGDIRFNQSQVLKIWNLVRSQIGMETIDKHNYLDVSFDGV